MSRHGSLTTAVLLALVGCQPHDLTWTFTVPADIDQEVHSFQAHVIPEDCVDGPAPMRPRETASYRFARGETPPVPIRTLPPGRWAFEIEALDAECRPIGRGCVSAELPSDSVLVSIRPIATEPSVCPEHCAEGICLGPDSAEDAGPEGDASAAP